MLMKDESTDGKPSEPRFKPRLTATFLRATKKLDQDQLKAALEEVLLDPYQARKSHTLSYEWAGFRAATFSGSDRIVYRICAECAQKYQRELTPLGCCADQDCDLLVVTFVHFGNYHRVAGNRRITPARFDLIDPT